ncbi:hypothetical protein HanPI659440_Chr12g0455691 [Helianthus annuus]|nr:hypothetical protein HanPI659440_Chr12g0455691 [Helianthus annuus]
MSSDGIGIEVAKLIKVLSFLYDNGECVQMRCNKKKVCFQSYGLENQASLLENEL